jgi:hypothetical protein
MSEGAGMQHARGSCPLKEELFSLFFVATAGVASLSRDNWSLFTV